MDDGLTIESREGLSLEAALTVPAEVNGIVVVCHPHPKMGGTMNAPLLLALMEAFAGDGWAVLRFNFRGIGASEGEPGTGIEEVADAHGALDLAPTLAAPAPDGSLPLAPPLPLAVVGWSFGGAVALRAAAERDDLDACIAIAPAIRPRPGITAGAPAPEGLSLPARTHLIAARNDHLVSPEDCEAWATAAGATCSVMPGANHFFWGKYDALAKEVTTHLPPTGSSADLAR